MNDLPIRDRFHESFGPPAISAEPLRFRDEVLDYMMSDRYTRIGAGWFLGRMFYLFGNDLRRLDPCVRAWSFLLPPTFTQWTIIGFNAYGCILLLDETSEQGTLSPVGMLDPLTVSYFTDPSLDIYSLLDHWLPERTLDHFVDTSVYRAYLETSKSFLADDEILGIRQALPLGGKMELDNFSRLPIVDYYRATGSTYENAYQRLKSEPLR